MPPTKRSCYGFDIAWADVDRRIEAIQLPEESRRKTSVFLQKKRNAHKGYYTLSDVASKWQTLKMAQVAVSHMK